MVAKRLGVAFLCAIGLVLTAGLGSASATPTPQNISLFEMDTADIGTGGAFTGNAPPKPGEGFISTGNYYKWAGTKKGSLFGHLQVDCTIVSITATGGEAQCTATAFFPGGDIEASGPLNFSAHTNKLPVVGGTGIYVGAQGYVATTNIGGGDSNTSADVIHITN